MDKVEHYNWHWFWEYGCADPGNQGPHQMDIARWALNKREYPQTIKCKSYFTRRNSFFISATVFV